MTNRPTEQAGLLPVTAWLNGLAQLFQTTPSTPPFTVWQRWLLCALIALGGMLRFWGVGSFGLHGPDEATTAIPALHILQDGWPRFPSGMLYTRAVVQSYLIAGSVALFGNNEWALRLPSVLCGTGLIALAVLVGRRFLAPAWNLALAAVVAALPGFIADSQIVRMYIFMSATLALYAHWVFRWEASGRARYLALAAFTMMVGIHFHQLAIFGSLVVFMPAILRGEWRLARHALYAFVAIMLYFVYVRWTPSEYPLPITDFDVVESAVGKPPGGLGLRFALLPTVLLLLASAVAAVLMWRRSMARSGFAWTVALLLLAAVAGAALFYHLVILLAIAAAVVAARQGRFDGRAALALLAVAAAVAAWQLHEVRAVGGQSLRKSLGVMVGQPSVWQYAALASFSLTAALFALGGLGGALLALARRRAVADLWLYFTLAVFIPSFMFGLTDWYFPARYTEFALLPLLVVAVGSGQRLVDWIGERRGAGLAAPVAMLITLVLAVAIVNPFGVARAVNAGRSFPDHRSAALYVRAQQPVPGDLVVAEDLLYPWYYLGHVDYWLLGRATARNFAERIDGRVAYQYTHTPLLGTASELEALLQRRDRGTVYIIGSGEDMADNRRFVRGADIAALLESGRLPVAYVAPDGLTRVWRIPPP